MLDQTQNPTLYEDWQLRRDRLASAATLAPAYDRVQIEVFDFLLGQQRDSPQAVQRVAVAWLSGLSADDRAIVVHHHLGLGDGRVAAVTDQQSAEARIGSVLNRMRSRATPGTDAEPEGMSNRRDEALGTTDAEQLDAVVLAELVDAPLPAWRSLWGQFKAIGIGAPIAINPVGSIEKRLRQNPFLPEEDVKYLYRRLSAPGKRGASAAELLLRCLNRSALNYAFLAWRERIATSRHDRVTATLHSRFRGTQRRSAVRERLLPRLADESAAVRLNAIVLLGEIGELRDIALLSDLLWLPRSPAEHPREREALAHAMWRLSGMAGSCLDSHGNLVEPRQGHDAASMST